MRKLNKKNQENKLRKELIKLICTEANGLISKNEAQEIVSTLSVAELLNRRYNLIVSRDSKEMSEHLTLVNHTFQHSSAGGDGYQEEGTVLIGNADFGFSYSYQYSDNGNMQEPETEGGLPVFNIRKKLAVVISRHTWDNYNGADFDEKSKDLLIYLPKKAC